MKQYYILVGKDGDMLMNDVVIADSMGILRFLVQDDMIAVVLNIDPNLCVSGESQARNVDVMARHVIKMHTTKDGWYIPQDKSNWKALWEVNE